MATAFVSGKKRERIKNLSKYKKRWVKHEDTNVDGPFGGEGEDGGGAGALGLPDAKHGTG
jgi:hypothetical protein